MDIDTTEDGQAVVTTWEGRRLPYRLTRLARVTRAGAVVMTYHAVNDSADRMPFIWSSHPLLALTEDTKLMLPEGSPMKVGISHKLVMGDSRSQHRWPFVRAAGRVLDFLVPFNVAKEYACKLFLDPNVGKAAIRQGQDELEVTFDTKEVPQLGVWINKGGWSPFRKEAPYMNLAIAPCLGAPDSLTDALGDWKKAQWLEPGEVRSWSITWQARRVAPDENESPPA
jgi:galactose mutarotase-like enzyme